MKKREYNFNMDSNQRLIPRLASPVVSSYATMLAIALMSMFELAPGLQRIAGMALLVMFGVVFWFSPISSSRTWKKHFYLSVQSILVCVLLVLRPGWSVFPILFFILSAHATMIFSEQRMGFIWVGLFAVFTGVIFMVLGDPLEGFISLLPFAAGYGFFAVFSSTLVAAEQKRQESQILLKELQLAHRQLQDYAVQAEEFAVSEERNRLAREMHDTLGHRLTVAAVQLEGAQRLIPVEPERASEMVGTVREEVREALGELRRTVATLREPLQTDIALSYSLVRLVDAFENATGLEVHLDIPEDEIDLCDAHRLTLYRAVQEALTNVQRHAHAKNVWVSLGIEQGDVVFVIRDDGAGFSAQTPVQGFGLRGLQERVSQINGSFCIDSDVGEGTQLRILLPVRMEREDG